MQEIKEPDQPPKHFPCLFINQKSIDPIDQGFVMLPDTIINAIDENKPVFFQVLLSGMQRGIEPSREQIQQIQRIAEKKRSLHLSI